MCTANDRLRHVSLDGRPPSSCNGNQATSRLFRRSKLPETLRTFVPVSIPRRLRHFLGNCECADRRDSPVRTPSKRYSAHNVPEARANPALAFEIATLLPI